jgi:hypothetical protein
MRVFVFQHASSILSACLFFLCFQSTTITTFFVDGFQQYRYSPVKCQAGTSLRSTAIENMSPFIPPRSAPDGVKVLSRDPLVYLIPNLLTPPECQAFIDRAQELEPTRPMKQSNPPEVSLDLSKLWPLPFLCLGAGFPPLIRYYQEHADAATSFPAAAAAAAASPPPMDELAAIYLPPVLVALASSFLLAFGVVLPIIRKLSDSSSRTSVGVALNLDEDVSYVRNLVDRVCTATQHPWHAWEAPVFTRYNPGALFARHSDASPTRGSEWEALGGQRVITCICYLNTVEQQQNAGAGAGATSFDRLGIDVAPVQGNALLFFPTKSSDPLAADDLATHESLVARDEKCIIQMFGRVGPRVPHPLGLPDSYGN